MQSSFSLLHAEHVGCSLSHLILRLLQLRHANTRCAGMVSRAVGALPNAFVVCDDRDLLYICIVNPMSCCALDKTITGRDSVYSRSLLHHQSDLPWSSRWPVCVRMRVERLQSDAVQSLCWISWRSLLEAPKHVIPPQLDTSTSRTEGSCSTGDRDHALPASTTANSALLCSVCAEPAILRHHQRRVSRDPCSHYSGRLDLQRCRLANEV